MRLNYSEFPELISEPISLDFNGYKYDIKNRKMERKSGGLLICVKSKMDDCVDYIDTECKFVH